MPEANDEFIPTRASLLGRLRNLDDHASWQDFFDTYWKMLYSVARRSGLADSEAQDIVQETIAGVAKRMPEFCYDAKSGSFKAWLMTIVRRRIIDYFRRLQRQPPRHNPDPEASATGTIERIPDPSGNQIDQFYEEEWAKGIFQFALAKVKRRLDSKQFQLFDCYAIQEWPVEEVASNFNVSVSLVYTTKSRVIAMIKEEVRRLEQNSL